MRPLLSGSPGWVLQENTGLQPQLLRHQVVHLGQHIVPHAAMPRGDPIPFYLLGRSESARHQGFGFAKTLGTPHSRRSWTTRILVPLLQPQLLRHQVVHLGQRIVQLQHVKAAAHGAVRLAAALAAADGSDVLDDIASLDALGHILLAAHNLEGCLLYTSSMLEPEGV